MLSDNLAEVVTGPANGKLKVVHTGIRCFESRCDKVGSGEGRGMVVNGGLILIFCMISLFCFMSSSLSSSPSSITERA